MGRVSTMLLVAVIPGALLVLGAYVLARILFMGMQREQGHAGQRLARAVVRLRPSDVWAQTRRLL